MPVLWRQIGSGVDWEIGEFHELCYSRFFSNVLVFLMGQLGLPNLYEDVTGTLGIGAVPRAAGNGQHLIESLHEFIPLEVIAADQKVTARGTTEQLGMVDETLLGI